MQVFVFFIISLHKYYHCLIEGDCSYTVVAQPSLPTRMRDKSGGIIREMREITNLNRRKMTTSHYIINKLGLVITIMLLSVIVASCTKESNTIFMPDPVDLPNSSPLVTVVYDPNGLGDRSYNDLIYQGVEIAAQKYGLRTLQLSPSSQQEGLKYVQTTIAQMVAQTDTIRRLLIVAGASYDDYLRANNNLLDANNYTELLYLDTNIPLNGKGSTLYLPYYGAMFEAGALAPAFTDEVLLIGANPINAAVAEAVQGFTDGYASSLVECFDFLGRQVEPKLHTVWLSNHVAGGFTVADSTTLKLIHSVPWQSITRTLVPVCGGAARTFNRIIETLGMYDYIGVDTISISTHCHFSVVKHIDRAVSRSIGQWLSDEGMPKHQTLGLADGYTEVIIHPILKIYAEQFQQRVSDGKQNIIHELAIRKEAEHDK